MMANLVFNSKKYLKLMMSCFRMPFKFTKKLFPPDLLRTWKFSLAFFN